MTVNIKETKIKINESWLPLIQDATTTSKGIVQVGSGITVENGVISVPYGIYPSLARLYTSDTTYGTLIVSNVYNGTIGQLPSGIVLQNPDDEHTVQYVATASMSSLNHQGYYAQGYIVVQAKNTITGATRTLFNTGSQTEGSTWGVVHTWSGTATIKMTDVLTGYAVNQRPSEGGISFGSMASADNTVYLGSPT